MYCLKANPRHTFLYCSYPKYSNTLILCPLGNISVFFVICWFFFKINFFKNAFRNTIWVSNRLAPDQARCRGWSGSKLFAKVISRCHYEIKELTSNHIYPKFLASPFGCLMSVVANSVNPDQPATSEAGWSGFPLFLQAFHHHHHNHWVSDYMGESSKFPISWTLENQNSKLAVCLQNIKNSKLNGQLPLDKLKLNHKSDYYLQNSAFWGGLSMESQPQNPEFRNNPEKFHPCD